MKYGKIFALLFFVAIMSAAAGFGYKEYSKELTADSEANQKVIKDLATGSGDAQAAENPAQSLRNFDAKALKPHVSDIVIGDKNAPVRIVEYASLSCPHCAKFHTNILPALKEEFIDTGKAVLVFRHFPLNAPAMKASMAINCASSDNRADFTKHLFETQRDWAFDSNYLSSIISSANSFGLTTEAIERCFSNVSMEDQILNARQQAEQKLQVASTPSFFINGKRLAGAANLENMQAAIQAALQKP